MRICPMSINCILRYRISTPRLIGGLAGGLLNGALSHIRAIRARGLRDRDGDFGSRLRQPILARCSRNVTVSGLRFTFSPTVRKHRESSPTDLRLRNGFSPYLGASHAVSDGLAGNRFLYRNIWFMNVVLGDGHSVHYRVMAVRSGFRFEDGPD